MFEVFLAALAIVGPMSSWRIACRIPLEPSLGRVLDVTWAEGSDRIYVLGAAAGVVAMDRKGRRMGSWSMTQAPRHLHLRNDTLMVSSSAATEIVFVDAATLKEISRIIWRSPYRTTLGSYRPVALLADGSVWAAFRGAHGTDWPVTRFVFDETGKPAGDVGSIRRLKRWLIVRDPNGRGGHGGQMMHPADFASFVSVSPSATWIGMLDQEVKESAIVHVALRGIATGDHSTSAMTLTTRADSLTDEERGVFARRISAVFPEPEGRRIKPWLEYALRDTDVLPFATSMRITDEGTFWIARDINVWGSRRWTVMAGSTRQLEVVLPEASRLLWVSEDSVIGVSGVPGQGYELLCFTRMP